MAGTREAGDAVDWDGETDVVVVGAGGAGLAAALTAATTGGGARVVLLEKDAGLACNSVIASGFLQAAGTRFQREAGVDDSPELMADDILGKNGGRSDRELTLALCRRAAEVVHWLADDVGVSIRFAPEAEWPGHSRPRMHGHPSASGLPIVAALRARIEALPAVRYADRAPGLGLVADDDGAVVGVVAGGPKGPRRIACGRVVLATGGFGADRRMLGEYIPDMADAPYIGARSNGGEGIRWGIAVGAAVGQMSGYQGFGYVVAESGARLHPGVMSGGGAMVNAAAERFEREDQGPSEMAAVVRRQSGSSAIAIWDGAIHETVAATNMMVESQQVGAVVRCPTVADLARRFDLDEHTLARTLAAYDRAVAVGRDPLGRQALPRRLLPPYFVARVTGALAHTQGGLRIDVRGRVLRPDGRPIPNLYAVGGTAAGLSGDTPDGYLPGNGLLTAYTLGRIAGEDAAASISGTG